MGNKANSTVWEGTSEELVEFLVEESRGRGKVYLLWVAGQTDSGEERIETHPWGFTVCQDWVNAWGYIWLVGENWNIQIGEAIALQSDFFDDPREGMTPEMPKIFFKTDRLAKEMVEKRLPGFLRKHYPKLADLPIIFVTSDEVDAAESIDEIEELLAKKGRK